MCICIGSIFFLFFLFCYRTFGWHIAYHRQTTCIMHNYLYLYCPGCGGTRALDAFLRGEIWLSLLYNPFLMVLVGLASYYFVMAFYSFVVKKDGKIYYNVPVELMMALAVLLVIYTAGRNIVMIVWEIDPLQDLVVYWK